MIFSCKISKHLKLRNFSTLKKNAMLDTLSFNFLQDPWTPQQDVFLGWESDLKFESQIKLGIKNHKKIYPSKS